MNAKNGKETLANSLSTKVRVYIPRITYNIDTFVVGTDKGIYTVDANGWARRMGPADQINWDTVGRRIQNLKSLPYPVLIGIRDLL